MKVLAIIQARLSSERLPNKVLLQIPPNSGVSMLEMVIRKAMLAAKVDKVIVVTPDKEIAKICDMLNINCYVKTWPERDVLKEFFYAARLENMHLEDNGVIVRLTADCPLLQPEIIDKCIEEFLKSDVDLVYNTDESINQLAGEGSDVEVFSYKTLEITFKKARGLSEEEHVTLWMRRFCNKLFVPCHELGILSVNTRKDYEKVCEIISE